LEKSPVSVEEIEKYSQHHPNTTGIQPIKPPAVASHLQKHFYPLHPCLMLKIRKAVLASAQNGLKSGEERPEKKIIYRYCSIHFLNLA
jgi:hypothetical protein